MNALRNLAMASAVAVGGAGFAAHAVASTPASHAHKVTVKATEVSGKYAFAPTKKTVKVGTTVVWKNTSDAPHTVTSKTSSWKFNKSLDPGKTVKFTFHKKGTFTFYCTIHPWMVGKIVVK